MIIQNDLDPATFNTYILIGSAVTAVFFGLIPLIIGFVKKQVLLGIAGMVIGLILALIFKIGVLAIPTAIIFTVLIFRKSK